MLIDTVTLQPSVFSQPSFHAQLSWSLTGYLYITPQCQISLEMDVWDLRLTSAANKPKTRITFTKPPYINNPALRKDAKHLMRLLIEKHINLSGYPAASTYARWATLLNQMANYCLDNYISLKTCISNQKIYIDFIKHRLSAHEIVFAVSLVKTLHQISEKIVGCKIELLDSSLEKLEKTQPNEDQTLVIPSRILFECINECTDIVSDFNNNASKIQALLFQLNDSSISKEKGENNIPPFNFNESVIQHGLSRLADTYRWSNAKSFGRYLSNIQFCCKTLIHIYSGMRDDEIFSLYPNCLCLETIDGDKGYWLHGTTSKGYRSKHKTAWVSSIDLIPAIEASERICEWIRVAAKISKAIPIFSSINYFSFTMAHKRTFENHNGLKLANLRHYTFNKIFKKDVFIITNNDLEEIKYIEYARNWLDENTYTEGKHWHFNTHQYRRSLAYYGVESGLVSFSAMHAQLQHIRMRMTVHYTRGGAAANSLIGNSPYNFKNEFTHIKDTVTALDYTKTILLSEERLLGGHGKHVETQIKPLGRQQILFDRAKTIEQVKSGALSYSIRPTGGCTNPSPCHEPLLHPLSSCIGCPSGAVLPSRIKLAISRFEVFLSSLPQNTPQHAFATAELELTKHKIGLQSK